MQYVGTTLIIVLSITLLLAVGWIVFNVGRVVFCIVRDARKARRHPLQQMEHPEFGPLTLDGELWSGRVQRDGRAIDFIIAGTQAGPDSGLAECLRKVIRRFPEFERAALEFIRTHEPLLAQGQFSFESLELLFEQKPELFGMGFTLPDDPDGCWRVDFESERPKFVGRDD